MLRFSKEDYLGVTQLYPFTCAICNTEFQDTLISGKIPRCPSCYPPQLKQGIIELEVQDWLRSIVSPSTILEVNTRKVIAPLELDIYLPQFQVALEIDEVYWHSEIATQGRRGRSYHIHKTEACNILGITLIHIWDTEWIQSKEIVKSIISTRLGILGTKIGARQCEVREISSKDSEIFLNQNHIQGFAAASIRYGLYYNNELVAHLALGKNRFKTNTYEIVRYAVKTNTSVAGGLSKLWKIAIQKLPNNATILSYVDKRYFNGNSNGVIGLQKVKINPPGFYYTKDYKTLENRLRYQKHKLPLLLPTYDPSLTEWENMQIAGYDRIWDCGTDVWEIQIQKRG